MLGIRIPTSAPEGSDINSSRTYTVDLAQWSSNDDESQHVEGHQLAYRRQLHTEHNTRQSTTPKCDFGDETSVNSESLGLLVENTHKIDLRRPPVGQRPIKQKQCTQGAHRLLSCLQRRLDTILNVRDTVVHPNLD